MQTECPHCETVFALNNADLERAEGRVRCGECQHIFDARDRLLPDPDSVEDGSNDSAFTETGVGWVVLPADAPADAEDEEARYVGADESQAWEGLAELNDAPNSPDNERRYDDNSPLPDEDDVPNSAKETLAHDVTPLSFTLVKGGQYQQASEKSAQRASDSNSTEIESAPVASDDYDDWATLLAEIDVADTNLTTTRPAAEKEDTEEPAAEIGGGEADAEASDATEETAAAAESSAEDGDEAQDEDTERTEDDPLRGNDDSAAEAGIDTEVRSEAEPTTDTASSTEKSDDGQDDLAVDSSGIFVKETDLPDSSEIAAIEASALASREHNAASDTAHFTDERSDDADIEPWLSDTDETEASDSSAKKWRYGALALALLVVAQLAHFQRSTLATQSMLYPWYERIYGDTLFPSWPVNEVCFEQRDAIGGGGRMLIAGQIANRSSRALPYPLVHVTLSGRFDDGTGDQSLAHGVLQPSDYLETSRQGDWVAGGSRFDAIAEFDDPRDSTSGFDLEVCYPSASGELRCNPQC